MVEAQCPRIPSGLRLNEVVQVACIWEATARKPGNVQPGRDFADLSYADLLVSAAVVAPVLENAWRRPVGATVLEAIRATRRVASTNVNLGIVLLLAPLAAVGPDEDLRAGVNRVLSKVDRADARNVYEAIRLARPGGLGRISEQDVAEEPTRGLREVMALAADRDLVARQYVNDFADVLDHGVPALRQELQQAAALEEAIIACHLQWMARYPDSLLARKCGIGEAEEASRRAARVLKEGWPRSESGRAALAELDAWLCADGHRRNPGTTADLVAACLFVALREGIITLPTALPWARSLSPHPCLPQIGGGKGGGATL